MPATLSLVTTSVDFGDVPVGETAVQPVTVTVTGGPASVSTDNVTPGFSALSKSLVGIPTGVGTSRFWVTYRAPAAPGPQVTGSISIHGTGGTVVAGAAVIQVRATPVARTPLSICLVLDTSGSMGQASGFGGTRMDTLKLAAVVPGDLLLDDDHIGIVQFDSTARVVHPLAPAGPLQVLDPNVPQVSGRPALHAAINGLSAGGGTSIGAGVQTAATMLGATSRRATAVFTDGEENTHPLISDVQSQISGTVYAIGLGTAAVLNPGPLTALCAGHDGYLSVTGTGQIDSQHDLQLEKYFLRVLAGMTNNQMITDPWRDLHPGEAWDLPFAVTEVDADFTVVALSPDPSPLDVTLETPGGTVPWGTRTEGIRWATTPRMKYARITTPVAGLGDAGAGEWRVRVFRRGGIERATGDAKRSLRVDVSVLSRSALTLAVEIKQSGSTAGSAVQVQAVLALAGVPWSFAAEVTMRVTAPDGSTTTTTLKRFRDDTYMSDFTAESEGSYQLEITADGEMDDFRPGSGTRFTRYAHRTVSVWQPRDKPRRVPGRIR